MCTQARVPLAATLRTPPGRASHVTRCAHACRGARDSGCFKTTVSGPGRSCADIYPGSLAPVRRSAEIGTPARACSVGLPMHVLRALMLCLRLVLVDLCMLHMRMPATCATKT
jgi:hypothetical protein